MTLAVIADLRKGFGLRDLEPTTEMTMTDAGGLPWQRRSSAGRRDEAPCRRPAGHAKLTTTARHTRVATRTIRDTVIPNEMLAKLLDQTIIRHRLTVA